MMLFRRKNSNCFENVVFKFYACAISNSNGTLQKLRIKFHSFLGLAENPTGAGLPVSIGRFSGG